MKRYVMVRFAASVVVMAVDGGTKRLLEHLERHSPDGFEWGYLGSGPADLARSIVGDVLGSVNPSPRIYQRVKSELVAKVPRDGGVITSAEVCDIIEEVLGS